MRASKGKKGEVHNTEKRLFNSRIHINLVSIIISLSSGVVCRCILRCRRCRRIHIHTANQHFTANAMGGLYQYNTSIFYHVTWIFDKDFQCLGYATESRNPISKMRRNWGDALFLSFVRSFFSSFFFCYPNPKPTKRTRNQING